MFLQISAKVFKGIHLLRQLPELMKRGLLIKSRMRFWVKEDKRRCQDQPLAVVRGAAKERGWDARKTRVDRDLSAKLSIAKEAYEK